MLASLLSSSSTPLSWPYRSQEPYYLSPQSPQQDPTVTASPFPTFPNYAVTNVPALPHFSQPTPHPAHLLPHQPWVPRDEHFKPGNPWKGCPSRLPHSVPPPPYLPPENRMDGWTDTDTQTTWKTCLSVCLPDRRKWG